MKVFGFLLCLLAFSVSAFSCVLGVEYYSVVVPKNLSLMDEAVGKLVVGDLVVLSENLSIKSGKEFLERIGFYDGLGSNSGKYYLVSAPGLISLAQKYKKRELTRSFLAEPPPRYRGGCSDFRHPNSESSVKK